jgi:hypothetical protein
LGLEILDGGAFWLAGFAGRDLSVTICRGFSWPLDAGVTFDLAVQEDGLESIFAAVVTEKLLDSR